LPDPIESMNRIAVATTVQAIKAPLPTQAMICVSGLEAYEAGEILGLQEEPPLRKAAFKSRVHALRQC
jgi:hypothetical protein